MSGSDLGTRVGFSIGDNFYGLPSSVFFMPVDPAAPIAVGKKKIVYSFLKM